MKLMRQFLMSTGPHRTGFWVRAIGHFIINRPEPQKFAHFGEIFWCISGTGYFTAADGEEIQLHPGGLWYYPPNSFHKFRPGKKFMNYRWLSIEGPTTAQLFQALNFHPGTNQAGRCPEEEFARIEINLQENTQQAQMRALEAAFCILSRAATPEFELPPIAAQAKQMIDENFAKNRLNVTEIAELLNIHRVSLSRIFSSSYGMSVMDYLISVRLKNAMSLLKNTALPLKEVAMRCGFADAGYFSKAFHKLTEQSPREFRARLYSGISEPDPAEEL